MLRKTEELEQRVAERTAELTAEIRRREALEESLRSQAQFLQVTHDAIIVRSFEGATIRFWNPAASELYGWSEGEALGKSVDELLRSRYHEPLSEIEEILARTGRWEGEAFHTRKNGTELVLDCRWSLRRGHDGRPLEIFEVNSDITAKKYAEQKVRENERLAGVGAVTAIFAHEIGNPLHSMSTSLELIDQELSKTAGSNSELKCMLELAVQDVQRMTKLLREFRSFARPRLGPLKVTNLVEILRNVLVPQAAVCRQCGITINTDFKALPPTLVDDDKIEQVILNLCKNAIEAMPDGGVLTIKTHQKDDLNVIEISDTGIGIPEGLDVFQPFTTTKANGSGLGLPIARQIIGAHQGTIDYTSEPGRGSTFRLYLPALEVSPLPPKQTAKDNSSAAGTTGRPHAVRARAGVE